MRLSTALASVLEPAYRPCSCFKTCCREMRWNPKAGHVPRGFLGACGRLTDVELVLVFAEPGDPHAGERHSGLKSAYEYATVAFHTGMDQFHRNVRHILDLCYPGISFEEQMRKVWLTESVLCSAKKECGPVSKDAALACGNHYLLPQLSLLRRAMVVALGRKAQRRLCALGVTGFHSVAAVAPPGCNRVAAKESWESIPVWLSAHRERHG